MTLAAIEAPQLLLQRVVEVLRPEAVWLFGSQARGDASPESDWDLLVVLPDDAPDELLDGGQIWELCLRDASVAADIVPVRRAAFEQLRGLAGSLCRTVAEEGRPIYGR